MERYAIQLRQLLGAHGCTSRSVSSEKLLEVAKLTFRVPGKGLDDVAVEAGRLGPQERLLRAREAVRKHWPEPTRLWPAHALVRR